MVLTNRDKILFLKLQSYGLLTTRQLGNMVFPNVCLTTVLRRLRKLESKGYIKRLLRLDGYEIAWSVTFCGVQIVGDLPIKRNFRSDTLDHDLKLTDVRIALEGSGIAQSWTPEHTIRSKVAREHGLKNMRDRVIPDGLMGVNWQGAKESVAVELELNFKNTNRYYKTFRQYHEKSSLWGVWYIVHSEGLGRAVEREWGRSKSYYEGNGRFLWSLVDDVLKDPLNTKIRADGVIYNITEIWKPLEKKPEKKLEEIPALKPAHTPAFSLSSGAVEIGTNSNASTDGSEKEKLALAS